MLNDKPIKSVVKPLSNNTLVVVFISIGYLNIFKNWHKYSANYLQDNLLVVALDPETHQVMQKKNVMSHYLDWNGNLGTLWKERVNIFKELLIRGYDIIHSDVDAIWLQNPIDYCSNINADMIFSQGTIWPPQTHEKLGAVLCCGFFKLKSTTETISLVDQWLTATTLDGDDQRALNELLYQKGLKWVDQEDYSLQWKEKSFRCFNETQYSTLSNKVEIALLPHHHFQRVTEDKPAVVKHPLSDKNGDSTESILKQNNCWAEL